MDLKRPYMWKATSTLLIGVCSYNKSINCETSFYFCNTNITERTPIWKQRMFFEVPLILVIHIFKKRMYDHTNSIMKQHQDWNWWQHENHFLVHSYRAHTKTNNSPIPMRECPSSQEVCLACTGGPTIHYIQRGYYKWDKKSSRWHVGKMHSPIKRDSSYCPRPSTGPNVDMV